MCKQSSTKSFPTASGTVWSCAESALTDQSGSPSTSELVSDSFFRRARKKASSTQLKKTLLIPAVNSLLAEASSNSHVGRHSISSRVLIMPDI